MSRDIQVPDQRTVYQDHGLHQHLHAGQPGHLGQGGGLRLPLRDDPRIREPGVHLDDAGEIMQLLAFINFYIYIAIL